MKNIIYARKSSEDEDRQAMSINSQISEIKKLADNSEILIDKIFTESQSAKQEGRPKFNEMLSFIDKTDGCQLLCWKIDRLTRNITDGARLVERLENGKIENIRTIDKKIANNPTDKFLLLIDFGVGKKYSDDLSVNVLRGNKTKLENGGLPGRASFGYKNNKLEKTIFVNEEKRKPLQKTFRKYATGGYSLKEMINESFKLGLMTDRGTKVYTSILHRIFSSPFYYGVIKRDGNFYKGSHEPIISQRIFDDVQEVLKGKHRGRRKKHFYPYRSFLTCEKCGCALTADKKKGHTYYYCTNGKGNCEEHRKYLRSEKIDEQISKVFNQIFYRKELIETVAEANSLRKTNDQKEFEELEISLRKQLEACKLKQEDLLDRSLEKKIGEELFEHKMKKLEKEQIDLETVLSQKRTKGRGTFEQTKKVFLTANKAQKEFLKQDDQQKRKTLEIILSNVSLESQQVAKVSFKMPYKFLANAPENGDFTQLLGKRDSNPRILEPETSALPLGDSPNFIFLKRFL